MFYAMSLKAPANVYISQRHFKTQFFIKYNNHHLILSRNELHKGKNDVYTKFLSGNREKCLNGVVIGRVRLHAAQ